MLNKFEQANAKKIREQINQAIAKFIFEPRMQEWTEELEIYEKKCEHKYDNGVCIFCGKEKK